jgi:LmbE family N-acetylglucosaminyl deacetylase
MATHLYLSPHLDDVVISCGGLLAQQTAHGDTVTVLTICAGDPPAGQLSEFAQEHHERWGENEAPIALRRAEDRIACGRLDASVIHLDIPDAVYRQGPEGDPLYTSNDAIYGSLHPEEQHLLRRLDKMLAETYRSIWNLYCPLGIGGHVDHRLTRVAAERMDTPLLYYRDLPYAARGEGVPSDLGIPDGEQTRWPLSAGEIDAWASAVALYQSQLSGLWLNIESMHQELRDDHDAMGGTWLLKRNLG